MVYQINTHLKQKIMTEKELKPRGKIIYLVENGSLNYVERSFGAIIKIGRKSYSIGFSSPYWWKGDEFTLQANNLTFKEAGVRPTANMIIEAKDAIGRYKGSINDFRL